MNSVTHRSIVSSSPASPDSPVAQPESTDIQRNHSANRTGPGFRLPSRRIAMVLAIPAMIALGISIYLAIVAFTKSQVAGCGGGVFDCSHVLNSKWSSFLGVPVALMAAITYAGMLAAIGYSLLSRVGNPGQRFAWMGISMLGIAAGLAAMWFVSLQVFVIGHLCPWCLAAHSCGLFIAVVLLTRRPFTWPVATGLSGLAAAGLAVLVTVQMNSVEPPRYQEIVHEIIVSPGQPTSITPGDIPVFGAPVDEEDNVFEAPFDDASYQRESNEFRSCLRGLGTMALLTRPSLAMSVVAATRQPVNQESVDDQETDTDQEDTQTGDTERRLVSIRGGSIQLDARQWPLIGSPDADHIFVEMFDYGCPHCRATHSAIREACHTLGDEVAVIVLAVPLNRNCNDAVSGGNNSKFRESCELSRLAVACWRVSPEDFQVFHEWMFEGSSVPSYARAKQRVDELVGREAIDEELGKKAAGKYIAQHVELYKRVGRGNVPKLLFPGTSIEGEFTSGQLLVDKIRTNAR